MNAIFVTVFVPIAHSVLSYLVEYVLFLEFILLLLLS
jgi:hypothetical protein